MYLGLSPPGASTPELSFAAADRRRAQPLRAVLPANPAVESRDKIRDRIQAAGRAERIALRELTPKARLGAERSVTIETTRRTQQPQIYATGNFVDLRV